MTDLEKLQEAIKVREAVIKAIEGGNIVAGVQYMKARRKEKGAWKDFP